MFPSEDEIVRLRVGDTLVVTSTHFLNKFAESRLPLILRQHNKQAPRAEPLLLLRDADAFLPLLKYVHSGVISGHDRSELEAIHKEAEFWRLAPLTDLLLACLAPEEPLLRGFDDSLVQQLVPVKGEQLVLPETTLLQCDLHGRKPDRSDCCMRRG